MDTTTTDTSDTTTKQTIRQFRRYSSLKGDLHHGPSSREFLLAYTHAKGRPHERAEPRVHPSRLPDPEWIHDCYQRHLEGTGLPVPTLAELTAWATVPEERQRQPKARGERPTKTPQAAVDAAGVGTTIKKAIARLYLVVRTNLPPGDQAVQAAHAMREFAEEHREEESAWYRESNTVAMLAARDEQHLLELCELARSSGHAASGFREPDLGGSLTAVAFSPQAGRLLAGLPLALKSTGS